MKWSAPTQTDGIVYHQLELAQPQAFKEVNQQACDVTAYYAMSSVGRSRTRVRYAPLTIEQVQGASWQTCEDTVCRTEFAANGTLNSNANNMTSRAISK